MPSRSSTSENGGTSPPRDSDSTSTPSLMASSMAFRTSAAEYSAPNGVLQHTLYMATRALGAPPRRSPGARPL
ncbi:hypothetical protein PanWU01x14_317980 [Parasponia andersonii]|uniref:Uncharacterized protein n=1 Tax=Parasponia andersonii TaxID=3476 RepID=A0A2P5AMT4_PARAD|nr:hypothetical protein PanWU01x14_317980 [Parasponia andersonii]